MSNCPEPGIYPNTPFDKYLKWDAVNNSLLSVIVDKSPQHAKEYRENPPPQSQAFEFGQALHTRVLECDKFPERYILAPVCDRRTKEGKAIWGKFVEPADGKIILKSEDYDAIQRIAEAITGHAVYKFIQNGEAEVCIVWDDPKSGLRCKARLDYVHREQAILIDVKTAKDASPLGFGKALYNYRYFQQAAWYSDGWKVLTDDLPAFVFLPAEKIPPYAVAAYEIADETIIAGRQAYRKALEIYTECIKTDVWPGYSGSVEMMQLPDWALKLEGVNQYQIIEE